MGLPYGNTTIVLDDGSANSFATTDAASHPATWLQIKNRDDSVNSFDVSYDGSTYITRLQPGMSMQIGGFASSANPPFLISTIYMKCRETPAGGTTTAEVTCGN